MHITMKKTDKKYNRISLIKFRVPDINLKALHFLPIVAQNLETVYVSICLA